MFYPYTISLAHQYVRLTTAGWQAVPAGGIIVPSYIPSSFSSHSGGERTTNERANRNATNPQKQQIGIYSFCAVIWGIIQQKQSKREKTPVNKQKDKRNTGNANSNNNNQPG